MPYQLKKLLYENEHKWEVPLFDNEIEDFQAISDELQIPLDNIRKSFSTGAVRLLPKKICGQLKNSDINKANSFLDIVDISQKYQTKNPEYKSDWKTFKKAYKQKHHVNAPIVMKYENDYYLVSGNTRMMVANIMNIPIFAYVFVY